MTTGEKIDSIVNDMNDILDRMESVSKEIVDNMKAQSRLTHHTETILTSAWWDTINARNTIAECRQKVK